jgi:uncharacterized protein (TIGR00730 family)
MTPAFSICVYCASRPGHEPAYTQAAIDAGRWIGEHGGQLVYGGGRSGLMGIVAKSALDAGARVVGVIPKVLVDRELANTDCTELHVVETMHERKELMAAHADAFVALPGGIGTFEEFFEIWTWRQLGYHNKPVGLLNTAGYYSGLLGFIDSCNSSGLMSDQQLALIQIGTETRPLLAALVQESIRLRTG